MRSGMAIFPFGLSILPFFPRTVRSDAFARGIFKESAEGGKVFETQQNGYLLSTSRAVNQEPFSFGLYPLMDDMQRRRQLIGSKKIGKRFRRPVQHICVIPHLFLFPKMVVHQNHVLPHHVETVLLFHGDSETVPGDTGTKDDKPFEQDAQHLFPQVVPDFVFEGEASRQVVQGSRFVRVELEPHHPTAAMEKKTVARDFRIVAEDAVEIAVEQKSRVFPVDGIEPDMMEGCQRDDLVLDEPHFHMVDLQRQLPFPDPNEFIEAFVHEPFRMIVEAAR